MGDIDQPDVVATSFEEFYESEWHKVVALAFTLCGSTGMASDVAQDAFVAAFDRWDRIDNPSAWIRQVVANRSVSTFRRRASEAKALFRLGSPPSTAPPLDPTDHELWARVRQLPKRQAQVIALRYVDSYRIDEIASVLELSPNTVKTHLKRALAALAEAREEAP